MSWTISKFYLVFAMLKTNLERICSGSHEKCALSRFGDSHGYLLVNRGYRRNANATDPKIKVSQNIERTLAELSAVSP